MKAMYVLPQATTGGAWFLTYDINGFPFWTRGVVPQWVIPPPKVHPPQPTKPPSDSKPSGGYRISVGNWDEVYDTVSGAKTWYNKKTRKKTSKDPFR